MRRKCEAHGSVASFPAQRERACEFARDEHGGAKESIQSVQVPKGSYRNNTRNVVCFFDLNYYFAAM